jgi:hypothetical protein
MKELYDQIAFFTHVILLDQAFAHCPIFLTAASQGSLGRVSVPVWPIILSDQLKIIGLVGFYPTNNLILHKLILKQLYTFYNYLGLSLHNILPKNMIIPNFKVDSCVLLTRSLCQKHSTSMCQVYCKRSS